MKVKLLRKIRDRFLFVQLPNGYTRVFDHEREITMLYQNAYSAIRETTETVLGERAKTLRYLNQEKKERNIRHVQYRKELSKL